MAVTEWLFLLISKVPCFFLITLFPLNCTILFFGYFSPSSELFFYISDSSMWYTLNNVKIYLLRKLLYIILVNGHVLFDLTEKVSLEMGLPPCSPFKREACFSHSLFQGLFVCDWAAILAHTHFRNGKRMKIVQQARSRNSEYLKTALRQTISSRGYCCLSLATKMPAVGTGNWRFSWLLQFDQLVSARWF